MKLYKRWPWKREAFKRGTRFRSFICPPISCPLVLRVDLNSKVAHLFSFVQRHNSAYKMRCFVVLAILTFFSCRIQLSHQRKLRCNLLNNDNSCRNCRNWNYHFFAVSFRCYYLHLIFSRGHASLHLAVSVRRSARQSVIFLNFERFSNFWSCPTVRDWITVYRAFFSSS